MSRTAAMSDETVGDLIERLGDISPRRIRLRPPPGKATEKDLLRLQKTTDRLYELVDGTLVEKARGFGEGGRAMDIARLLFKFLDQHDLGDLFGSDTTMRLMPGLVRMPDVSFFRWERFPNRQRPAEPIPDIAPDLAIEVLSESNTPGEMKRKRREYFQAGVRLVWEVNPRTRTVEVFTAPEQSTVFQEGQSLDGGDVLPGLNLPVESIFARVPRPEGQ